jgi:hypothetical protein
MNIYIMHMKCILVIRIRRYKFQHKNRWHGLIALQWTGRRLTTQETADIKYLDVSPSRDCTPKQSLTYRLSVVKWRSWLWAWRYLAVPWASRRILTAKTSFRSRPSTFEICGGRCVTETGCSSSNSVLYFQCNSSSALYSYSSQHYT